MFAKFVKIYSNKNKNCSPKYETVVIVAIGILIARKLHSKTKKNSLPCWHLVNKRR